MREDNIAFKKRLYESKIKTARRLNLQWAGGLLVATTVLAILFLYARFTQ